MANRQPSGRQSTMVINRSPTYRTSDVDQFKKTSNTPGRDHQQTMSGHWRHASRPISCTRTWLEALPTGRQTLINLKISNIPGGDHQQTMSGHWRQTSRPIHCIRTWLEALPTGRQTLINMNKLATYLEAQIGQQTTTGHWRQTSRPISCTRTWLENRQHILLVAVTARTLCRARYTYNTSVFNQNCTVNNEPCSQCGELIMPDTNQQCHKDLMPGANQSSDCHDTMPSILPTGHECSTNKWIDH